MNLLNVFRNSIVRKETQWAILLLLILFVYIRAAFYEFNLDDAIITDTIEGKVKSISDLYSILKLTYNHTDYRPVVLISFGMEQLLFGSIRPSVSHSINLVLFFFICVSALNLFKQLFEAKDNLLLFSAILLFIVHPLNTEVVCSIKCRDNLLSMLLGINSTFFFLKFLTTRKNKLFFLLLVVIFSIAGILSKMDAIGFLLFNVGYVLFFVKDKKVKYIVSVMLLYITVTAIVAMLTNAMLSDPATGQITGKVTYTENPLNTDFSVAHRFIAFVNTVFYYFVKFVPLSGFRYYYGYNYLQVLSVFSFSFFCGLVIILSFILLFLAGQKKHDRILSVSIMGSFLLSLYALNLIVPVAGIIADRYIFMANLFFCLVVARLVQIILIHLQQPSLIKYVHLLIGTIFLALTMNRIPAWKDFKSLIDADAPKLYTSYEAMRIAAGVYYGEYEKEEDTTLKQQHLKRCIFFAEKGVQVYPKNSLLYEFLGQYYFKYKEPQKAIQCFKKSQHNNPYSVTGFTYLGDVYYSIQEADSSILYYMKGLGLSPSSQLLINNISTVYYDLKSKEACKSFNLELLKKDSTLFPAYENLGYYYLMEKDTVTSVGYFKNAVRYGMDASAIPIEVK